MCHERSFDVFHLWVRRVLRRRVGRWPRPASWGWASWETRASWRGCQPVCRVSCGSHPTPSHTRQAEPCSRNVDQDWQNWTVSICGPCKPGFFFVRFWKNSTMKKTQKKPAQEKNSAKFCPKTQPIAGFSLLKNHKKLPVWKKLALMFPKLNFSLENSMPRRLQALSYLQKSVQTKSLC